MMIISKCGQPGMKAPLLRWGARCIQINRVLQLLWAYNPKTWGQYGGHSPIFCWYPVFCCFYDYYQTVQYHFHDIISTIILYHLAGGFYDPPPVPPTGGFHPLNPKPEDSKPFTLYPSPSNEITLDYRCWLSSLLSALHHLTKLHLAPHHLTSLPLTRLTTI
jgi:hypothetical protein